MKSRATKEDEKYLALENYWKNDFNVEWHMGRQCFVITNHVTKQEEYTRCMYKAFKIPYLAEQYLNREKLDEAAADVYAQAADLLEISVEKLLQPR